MLRFVEPLATPLAPLAAPAASVTAPRGEGAGPFVPALQIPGRTLALIAFGSHVRGRPFLDRLTLVAIADAAEGRAALRESRLDLAAGEPGEARLTATLLLMLDPSHPPFDRHSRREAVAAAIERETLAALVPGAEPAPRLLAPHLLAGRGEPPAARTTLRGTVSIVVADDVPPLVSQRIVAYLTALGLRASVTAMSPEAAHAARAQVRLIRWSPEVAEPGLALRELASLAPASRLVRDAIDAADAELDVDRRRTLLDEAEAALRADRVLVPLCLVPASFGVRRGVHGVRIDPAGRLVLEDAWVEP
jgi:MarR-like DNA-binding transcriptional regulator SgrR of sgrS sRNA